MPSYKHISSIQTKILKCSRWRDAHECWIFHSQHLSAAAAYGHELTASQSPTYAFMCVTFPVIGLVMSTLGGGMVWGLPWSMPVAGQSGPARRHYRGEPPGSLTAVASMTTGPTS